MRLCSHALQHNRRSLANGRQTSSAVSTSSLRAALLHCCHWLSWPHLNCHWLRCGLATCTHTHTDHHKHTDHHAPTQVLARRQAPVLHSSNCTFMLRFDSVLRRHITTDDDVAWQQMLVGRHPLSAHLICPRHTRRPHVSSKAKPFSARSFNEDCGSQSLDAAVQPRAPWLPTASELLLADAVLPSRSRHSRVDIQAPSRCSWQL